MKPYLAKKSPTYKWMRIKFATHKFITSLKDVDESYDAFLNRLGKLYQDQNPE